MKHSLVILIFLLIFVLFATGNSLDKKGNSFTPFQADPHMEFFIDSLITKMTLAEKFGQLTQFRLSMLEDREDIRKQYIRFIREGTAGSFLGISGTENIKKFQKIAVEESRLKIPLLFAEDVIHGYRTIFPVPLAEASSWDPQTVELSARVAAIEATAAGLNWTYAPMVDVARDPRWGRIVEGSGEDPYLGSVMAAARVKGFQGTDLAAPNTLAACAKHFTAYGAAQGGRDYNIADISEVTLREIYLPPFHAAVKAGVQSIMASFNELNGIPMHANSRLLNGVLRGKWGFPGVVISDFTGVKELMEHGIAATREEAGIAALQAGVDIDMMSRIYQNDLFAAVKGNKLPEKVVDESVKRVLRLKYILGLFHDPYRYLDKDREKNEILSPRNIKKAHEVALKSIVLLRNENNVLPLSKNQKTIAVIGSLANDKLAHLGPWKNYGQAKDAVTILEAVRETVDKNTKVIFAEGYDPEDFSDTSKLKKAVLVANKADAIILVVGESPQITGEAASRSSITLPGIQDSLALTILASGKPVVVVLMNGRPLAISSLAKHAPAIIEGWFLGIQMGPAIADVIFGNYNPGGKLPATFPRATGQIPVYYNFKNTGRPSGEGKFTSKYIDLPSSPLFPFGYGLSYTKFEYKNLKLNSAELQQGDTLIVSVNVRNVGDVAGDEVVQLYIQDLVARVTRPVKELRRFRRINFEPGETRKVQFKLTKDDLAFFVQPEGWITEPGNFKIFVGGNSVDVIEHTFNLAE